MKRGVMDPGQDFLAEIHDAHNVVEHGSES